MLYNLLYTRDIRGGCWSGTRIGSHIIKEGISFDANDSRGEGREKHFFFFFFLHCYAYNEPHIPPQVGQHSWVNQFVFMDNIENDWITTDRPAQRQ